MYLYLRQCADRYYLSKSEYPDEYVFLLGKVENPENAFQLLIKDDPYYEDYTIEEMDELRREVYQRYANELKKTRQKTVGVKLMKEERLKLSEDNPYNNMSKSDFLRILQKLDIEFVPEHGEVIYEEK